MQKKHTVLLVIIIIQTFVFTFPHIYGVLNANEDFVFTGNFGPTNENNDTQCANCFYLTQGFKQSFDGAWIIEDKFQGYDTYPKILHLWWIIGGHIARITGMDILTFNLLQRWLWIVLSSIVVFNLSKSLFKKTVFAAFATLFFSFSNYLLFPTPEGTVFVSFIAAVVLPLAYLLLAGLFFLLYKYLNGTLNSKWIFPILTFELAFSYPYAMITFTTSVGLFFLYLVLSKQKSFQELAKLFFIIFTPALIIIAYDYYLVYTDPRLVGSQAHVFSAPLKDLLVGYLPFTFFAGLFALKLYLKNASRSYKNFWIFLYIFSLCSFLFTQIPTKYLAFSMQMIVGIQLPLILMSVEFIRLYVYPKTKTILMTIILIATFIPGIHIYQKFLYTIKRHNIPSYIPSEIYNGLKWIDQNASKQSQLLCVPHWSSYAGIFTGTRLYIGGDILFTPDYDNRLEKLKNALSSDTVLELNNFIIDEKIDYILYDSKMAEWDTKEYLKKNLSQIVYDKNHVLILKTHRN